MQCCLKLSNHFLGKILFFFLVVYFWGRGEVFNLSI